MPHAACATPPADILAVRAPSGSAHADFAADTHRPARHGLALAGHHAGGSAERGQRRLRGAQLCDQYRHRPPARIGRAVGTTHRRHRRRLPAAQPADPGGGPGARGGAGRCRRRGAGRGAAPAAGELHRRQPAWRGSVFRAQRTAVRQSRRSPPAVAATRAGAPAGWRAGARPHAARPLGYPHHHADAAVADGPGQAWRHGEAARRQRAGTGPGAGRQARGAVVGRTGRRQPQARPGRPCLQLRRREPGARLQRPEGRRRGVARDPAGGRRPAAGAALPGDGAADRPAGAGRR
ncbi:hypothetical protein D9M69_334250 [compost metagenome]